MPFASHSQQNTIASGSPVCFMQHILIYTNDYQSWQVPWSGCNCMVLEAGCFEPFGAMEFIDSLVSQRILAACLASVDILCAWSNMGQVAASDHGQKIG